MRAAVFHGPRDVRIEDVPDPARPAPDEVVLEVIRAAICGTDSSEWDHGPILCRPPVVLGHEFVGRVAEVGADVTDVRVGDRVVSGAGISCGQCFWCLRRPHQPVRRVPHAGPSGRRRARRVRHFARLHLPSRSRRVRRRRRRDDTAARGRPPCTLARRAGRRTRRSRSSAQAASARSSSRARRGARRKDAWSRSTSTPTGCRPRRALGANETVDASGRDLAELLLELTDGIGFDVVIEASGAPVAPPAAIAGARRGGRVLLVGLHGAPRELDLTPDDHA